MTRTGAVKALQVLALGGLIILLGLVILGLLLGGGLGLVLSLLGVLGLQPGRSLAVLLLLVLGSGSLGLGNAVGDQEVVEDRARLHLPQVQAKHAKVLIGLTKLCELLCE